jgi:hypothetical protein
MFGWLSQILRIGLLAAFALHHGCTVALSHKRCELIDFYDVCGLFFQASDAFGVRLMPATGKGNRDHGYANRR